MLESVEDQEGNLVLSKQRADFLRIWEKVLRAHDTGEIIEGKIVKRIKMKEKLKEEESSKALSAFASATGIKPAAHPVKISSTKAIRRNARQIARTRC